jgi:hypothetical protein
MAQLEMSAEEKEGYSLFAQYPFLREKTVPKEFTKAELKRFLDIITGKKK